MTRNFLAFPASLEINYNFEEFKPGELDFEMKLESTLVFSSFFSFFFFYSFTLMFLTEQLSLSRQFDVGSEC